MQQDSLFLAIFCFAKSLSLAVSAFNLFVTLVFRQFSIEKILSTLAEELARHTSLS